MQASRQNAISGLEGRLLFPDNTRFWCMVAVVAVHCAGVFHLNDMPDSLLGYTISCLFKFGTIGFFLVSGFLLESSIRTRAPLLLFKSRLLRVFLPWLGWSLLFLAVISLSDFVRHRSPFLPGAPLLHSLLEEAGRCLSSTSMWFVPNLFLSLALLLLFRRHLHRLAFGGVLFACTLYYSVNIYAQWTSPFHTRAPLAFTFYLWLGHFTATHLPGLNRLLHRVSARSLVPLTFLAGLLSVAESRLLLHLRSSDPLNTLRLSNQVFSLLVVLCLCKLPGPSWPRFVDVPRHTFGIYLSHPFIVGRILTVMRRLLLLPLLHPIAGSIAVRTALWAAGTLIAWSAGFLIARTLAASPSLCWTLGLTPPAPNPVAPALLISTEPQTAWTTIVEA